MNARNEMISDFLYAEIITALRRRYVRKPKLLIRERAHQEWIAVLEVEGAPALAAAWNLSRWLKKEKFLTI